MHWQDVLGAAYELYRQRHYSEVVACCRAALGTDPENVEVRLLTARALMALRRDGEAQVEVAAILRTAPKSPDAYQLLGELAFRRDELRAAEIFLREAVRLNPDDAHSQVLLDIISAMTKPAAAAAKLPAASAAAGPLFSAPAAPKFKAVGTGSGDDPTRVVASRVESIAIKLNAGVSGFGEYLVHAGVLTRAELFEALHLHERERCRVGEAAVRLGFASGDEVEQLARRYHAALGSATTGTARALA